LKKNLLIIGAGGHGSVVAEAAEAVGNWNHIGFVDDRYPEMKQVYKWQVAGTCRILDSCNKDGTEVFVAIGDNDTRLNFIYDLLQKGFSLATVIHPTACVSALSTIDVGTVILEKVVVQAGTRIGKGCILNSGCIITHDCEIGDGVHIAPGARIAGRVKIGDRTWLGIGATVIQKISIGANVTVGAGTVVIRDIPDNVKVVGVPGRMISTEGAAVDGQE